MLCKPFLDPTIQNQTSSSVDNNSGDYQDAIINFDPLNNRNNDVTKATSILSDDTALKGMDHQKLISVNNNVTTNVPNNNSVDNIFPNLEALQKQQQPHASQHSQKTSNHSIKNYNYISNYKNKDKDSSNCYYRHLQPQYILIYHLSKTNPLCHLLATLQNN